MLICDLCKKPSDVVSGEHVRPVQLTVQELTPADHTFDPAGHKLCRDLCSSCKIRVRDALSVLLAAFEADPHHEVVILTKAATTWVDLECECAASTFEHILALPAAIEPLCAEDVFGHGYREMLEGQESSLTEARRVVSGSKQPPT